MVLGKDGEAVLGVQAGVVAVTVDASQLDLITRSNLVAEISKEKCILGSWQPASGNLAWRLLQRDPLVVLVQSLHLVDLKRPETLTLRTSARLRLFLLVLVEGAEDVAALGAVELDHEELGQDAAAAGDISTGPDQLVQVQLPQAA